jgi:hypothetical protein
MKAKITRRDLVRAGAGCPERTAGLGLWERSGVPSRPEAF